MVKHQHSDQHGIAYRSYFMGYLRDYAQVKLIGYLKDYIQIIGIGYLLPT